MGQQIPSALNAISSQMDVLESLMVEPVEQELQAESLARPMATFRFALRMAKSQFDLLEQQIMNSRDVTAQAALLVKQRMIERSITSQFKTCIVETLERMLNDRCIPLPPGSSARSGE